MNFFARVKSLAAKVMLVIEFCHDCGRRVDQVWTADDALWARLLGDDPGPRCIGCFNKRAFAAGLFVRWVPRVEP